MSLEEDILIQNFLKNTLSEEEKNEVLLRMEKEEGFKEKVILEEQLFLNLNSDDWSISTNYDHPEVDEYEKLLRSTSTQELKETLSSVNAEYQIKQKHNNKPWLLYSGIAAVAVIIIGLTIFYPSEPSYDTLYTNYLNPTELPSLVNRGNNDQQLLTKVQKLFEAKKYDQALDILVTSFNNPEENKATIFLYTGISQMELNKFDDAERTFNKLIESRLMDAPKGTWYKALLFLKKNEPSKAKKLLIEIAKSPNNYKYKEASELLDKL